MRFEAAERIIQSRRKLLSEFPANTDPQSRSSEAAEGGCGVLGFASSLPIPGRHVLAASQQMHNRGNGKGGGIAMAGLNPVQARVDPETLRSHYLLQIALLDPNARGELEHTSLNPNFDIAQAYELDHLDDYRQLPDLEVRPPDVWRYFVRVKPAILERFIEENKLQGIPERAAEDEFVFQNSYRLNRRFYASLGEKQAFVLSHGRDLSVLKLVGYAEEAAAYYRLEDQHAHVWIAHQRYPTKGRVWHPGGAHPFIGLHEALVHNGDFANYHAVSEYLRQRNIDQLFLTDTEVSVQLFDLWDRVYSYPLEITLEALAPTSEHDFEMLPPDKRELYRAVQRTHIHGSPDGPWFFILARTKYDDADPSNDRMELLGITDTSMLRPQVFALYENVDGTDDPRVNGRQNGRPGPEAQPVQIGLVASERQAIHACLRSLAAEDERFQPLADRYWVARGGSHTDGGAFRFSLLRDKTSSGVSDTGRAGDQTGPIKLECADKYGRLVQVRRDQRQLLRSRLDPEQANRDFALAWEQQALVAFDDGGAEPLWRWLKPQLSHADWNTLAWLLGWIGAFSSKGREEWHFGLDLLNLLHDRRYPLGEKKRASLVSLVDEALEKLFGLAPPLNENVKAQGRSGQADLGVRRLTWDTRGTLRAPLEGESSLVLDTLGFPPEGENSAARVLACAYKLGWRHFITFNWRGGRFAGCGLGGRTDGTVIHLYGDVGDYAASGLDGAEFHIHGDGQDQLGQILKRGKLVIHGDVGQTFLYGAKGGEVYVLGSAAGRPLINAVGSPRVVINGTCLDYLAESFMAGDPLNGGGFAILNGVAFEDGGRLVELESPYPGGNLFSLASGGAIYLRDPYQKVGSSQLNGGAFTELSQKDWELIEPYLRENERLFDIRVKDLLTVDGEQRPPEFVYRKVQVVGSSLLAEAQNR